MTGGTRTFLQIVPDPGPPRFLRYQLPDMPVKPEVGGTKDCQIPPNIQSTSLEVHIRSWSGFCELISLQREIMWIYSLTKPMSNFSGIGRCTRLRGSHFKALRCFNRRRQRYDGRCCALLSLKTWASSSYCRLKGTYMGGATPFGSLHRAKVVMHLSSASQTNGTSKQCSHLVLTELTIFL